MPRELRRSVAAEPETVLRRLVPRREETADKRADVCVARCGVARTVNTCVTLFELFGDVLVSWAPLYYEAKILFVLFLTIPNFRVRALTRRSRHTSNSTV